MPSVGFLDVDDPRITRTVRAIEKHLMEDGLLLRYDTRRVNDGFAGRRRRVPHLARPSACDDLSFILDHCPGQIAGRVQRGAFLPLYGKKRPRDCCRRNGVLLQHRLNFLGLLEMSRERWTNLDQQGLELGIVGIWD